MAIPPLPAGGCERILRSGAIGQDGTSLQNVAYELMLSNPPKTKGPPNPACGHKRNNQRHLPPRRMTSEVVRWGVGFRGPVAWRRGGRGDRPPAPRRDVYETAPPRSAHPAASGAGAPASYLAM